jgi:hypothetical protein
MYVSFRKEELTETPHIGLFSPAGDLMSMAGFHIFHERYVEIGNIGTSPAHQNRGWGTRITSDICRLAREKSPHVTPISNAAVTFARAARGAVCQILVDEQPGILYNDTQQVNTVLIQSGGGTGPMKPGNRHAVRDQVPIPARQRS